MVENKILAQMDRAYAISELLKAKFNLTADVNYENKDKKTRTIYVTYDSKNFKGLDIYSESPDNEIIELFEEALISGKWNHSYKLNSNTIILSNIFNEYGLKDCGYIIIQNKVYYVNHEAENIEAKEIFDTKDIIGIRFDLHDIDDYSCDPFVELTVKTKDNNYLLADDGVLFLDDDDCVIRGKKL